MKGNPMTDSTPIDGEFIQELRGAYHAVRDRRIDDLLDFAMSDLFQDKAQNFVEEAMRLAPPQFETVLREKMRADHKPSVDRARAASLFLRGYERRFWTARRSTLVEARKLAGFMVQEPARKTKADLAREAGLPTTDYAYRKPRDGRTDKKIVDHYLYVQTLSDEAELIAARKPIDIDALGVALNRYLDALKLYFPAAYEAQTEHLRRTLAPVIAKAYVEITHDKIINPKWRTANAER
jgi:hypothetical protein